MHDRARALVNLDARLLVLVIFDDAELAEGGDDLLHANVKRQASHVHAGVHLGGDGHTNMRSSRPKTHTTNSQLRRQQTLLCMQALVSLPSLLAPSL